MGDGPATIANMGVTHPSSSVTLVGTGLLDATLVYFNGARSVRFRGIDDARLLEAAGAFAIVLECVPAALAQKVSQALAIPTIGIGGGNGCDGQVLVIHDLIGLLPGFKPKFVKTYRNLAAEVTGAVQEYIEDVKTRRFPAPEHSFGIADDVLEKLY